MIYNLLGIVKRKLESWCRQSQTFKMATFVDSRLKKSMESDSLRREKAFVWKVQQFWQQKAAKKENNCQLQIGSLFWPVLGNTQTVYGKIALHDKWFAEMPATRVADASLHSKTDANIWSTYSSRQTSNRTMEEKKWNITNLKNNRSGL